ncbi:hypothetical protein QBC47DRAFT_393995 [Echria macrotheca]|uniref:Uncharacterized protein n=1 Tax=Echria macrotheca TaxID=438768 RepID=A0AAJ0F6Q5_9PEZI|nr:hypothetical protein QBC47DRAFT_393995 [Echria macrotheca]
MSSTADQPPTARSSTSSRDDQTTLNDAPQKQPQPQARQAYVYIDKVKPPNPDAQPKKKSKIGAFLSKFQSPAVKKTTQLRDDKKLEEERTGVRTVQVTDTARSSNAWAAEGLGHALGN